MLSLDAVGHFGELDKDLTDSGNVDPVQGPRDLDADHAAVFTALGFDVADYVCWWSSGWVRVE